MKLYRVVITKSSDGQWMVLIKSKRNGRTIFQSETYKTKQTAVKTAANLCGEFSDRFNYDFEIEKEVK